MTYLELLSWARKGLAAEKEIWRRRREKAAQSSIAGAAELRDGAQQEIERIEVKERILDDLEEIHNRGYDG